MSQTPRTVDGRCAPEYAPVASLVGELVNERADAGLGVCVYRRGEPVLNLWGGTRDRDSRLPWQEDTLVNVFSATKAFTVAAALLLADRGELELRAPVADYWPAFAQNGKGAIRVEQVLNHTAGLAAFTRPIADADIYDWQAMIAHVETMAPNWPAGEQQGYHVFTFGWILGELIRRITGRLPGDYIRTELCRPLGLDFHIGLSPAELARVADVRPLQNPPTDQGQLGTGAAAPPQSDLALLAFGNPASLTRGSNSTAWRTAQVPAANGHGTAESLARLYSVLLSGQWRDRQLFSERARRWFVEPTTRAFDIINGVPLAYSLGFYLSPDDVGYSFGRGRNCFGHPGAGGSFGFADPDHELAFGFVTRNLGRGLLVDERVTRLTDSLYACLGVREQGTGNR